MLYFLTAVIVVLLTMTAGATGYFLAAIIEFVATFLVQVAMIKVVQDVRDGRADLSMDATISAGAGTCSRSWAHPSWPGSASGSAWCSLPCPA